MSNWLCGSLHRSNFDKPVSFTLDFLIALLKLKAAILPQRFYEEFEYCLQNFHPC